MCRYSLKCIRDIVLKLLDVIDHIHPTQRGVVVIVLLYCLFGREVPWAAINALMT
ncbi:hypothetical protein [Ideonella sp. A 288]|uniref:hypothetical protein n=1 Tax=Ideonella sp. A 288 TaxID=1962181 RepID=UPI0013031A2E|nr:hypothetical protein [Ideonella sp. A 288]